MVLQLIEFGAVLNYANITTEHRSPLLFAIELHNMAMVQALLLHGADVNMSDSIHGNTPLHLAIMTRQFHMISLLIKQPGVNLSLKNKVRSHFSVLLHFFADVSLNGWDKVYKRHWMHC